MPLDPVSYRDTIGNYQQQYARYQPQEKVQRQLDDIAADQTTKSPKHITPITLCYLSALLLPHLKMIDNSSDTQTNETHTSTRSRHPTLQKVFMALDSASNTRAVSIHTNNKPSFASSKTRYTLDFPLAEASSSKRHRDHVKHDATTGLITVEGEFSKRMLFSVMKNFLVDLLEVDRERVNDLELEWLQSTVNTPIIVANTELQTRFHRSKRISFTDRNKYIAEHITKNCAFETDIYNLDGENKGKILIFTAQRVENPFRMLYDDIPGYEPPEALQNTGEAVNFMVNVLTLGIKPLISDLIANYFRQKYYEGLNDEICATRQKHLSFAQFATALEVDGAHYFTRGKSRHAKPRELQNIISISNEASFVIRNRVTNIKTSLLFTGKRKGTEKTEYSFALKSKGDFEFEATTPDESGRNKKKQRIIYDKAEKHWRYDERGNRAPIDINLIEGESYITLFGENYPLRITDDMQYEIIALGDDGIKKHIPVYLNVLTKNWHLKTLDNYPFYSLAQLDIINKLKVNAHKQFSYHAIDNQNSRYYGKGQVFEVRNRADNIATTPPLYTVVEMNGKLVPVRMTEMEEQGVRYTAYHINTPMRAEYPLEWYEGRWRLERATSPHVSRHLAERIMPDMFVKNVKEKDLSTPDRQGIKWRNGRGFLKIRGRYVEIHKGSVAKIGSTESKILFAVYKNKQFQPIAPALWNHYTRRINDDWELDGILELLKTQSKERCIERIDFSDILQVSKSLFSPLPVNVEVTSSDALEIKRFILTVGEKQFVIETTRRGKNVNVLKGTTAELALSKYRRSKMGGDIDQISALRRDIDNAIFRTVSRYNIDIQSRECIASAAQILMQALNNIQEEGAAERSLIVGHTDFFHTSIFENNIFMSSNAVYKSITEILLPISAQHPNTIIIPGSIYLSQDLPEYMLNSNIRYTQYGSIRPVKDAVNFSAILVPVLYRGKVITIARKGEYLTHNAIPASSTPEKLPTLDTMLPDNATLTLNNMASFLPGDLEEIRGVKVGTLFAGKTLLPRERGHAGLLLTRQGGREEDVDRLFNNEFMIDDNKFLLVIDDEFIQRGDARPAVRVLACPFNETLNDCNHYDWIIHSTGGNTLDDAMRLTSYNYLLADAFNGGSLLSDVNHRMLRASYSPENKMTYYEFINNEEQE